MTARRLVVTIDGPGSSGKSTVGANAAARLGYRFCDTGVLYRGLTLLAVRRGVDPEDAVALLELVPEMELATDAEGRYVRLLVGGDDLTTGLHTEEVERYVSQVSRHAEVRAALLPFQRRLAVGGGIVVAGRDIGSVVLPDADVKIYLEVSVEERARRRAEQRGDLDAESRRRIEDELRRRDEIDSTRRAGPLRVPYGAVVIVTDGNTLEQTVDEVVGVVERAAQRPPSGSSVRTRIPVVVRVAAFICRLVLSAVARVSVSGLERVPRSGALIVVANHLSNADPPLVVGWLSRPLGRPMHILAKESLFVGPLGWFLRSQGVTPVRAGGSDVDAYRAARAVLERGDVLCIFPEGTRSASGVLGEPKPGVAMLAARSGVAVLPVGISGSDRFLGRGRRFPRIGARIAIRVGPPFSVTLDETVPRRTAIAAATERIMRAIAAQVDERHRGRYR